MLFVFKLFGALYARHCGMEKSRFILKRNVYVSLRDCHKLVSLNPFIRNIFSLLHKKYCFCVLDCLRNQVKKKFPELFVQTRAGSWGQDTIQAGTFLGFLNVLLRASGAQLGSEEVHICIIYGSAHFSCQTNRQGCINCGILVSGIRACGVSSEHTENMEMFSRSPT